MLWQIEISPRRNDSELARIRELHQLLTASEDDALLESTSRGYLLEGELDEEQARTLMTNLLVDSIVEQGTLSALGNGRASNAATVLLKAGVMDPVALSVIDAGRDLNVPLESVRTFRRYHFRKSLTDEQRELLFGKILCNDAIEQVIEGELRMEHLTLGSTYNFERITIPLEDLNDADLMKISREGQLSLSLEEMKVIQKHFGEAQRDPTDIELETIAQTWSEHCSHKTLKGKVRFMGKRYQNLLKETIFKATQEIREQLGDDDWCVSVFEDNAGVVKFDENYHVCFKVETHNRPSAIEPYGGASTGIGGVIRDPLGTGLGAKPVCSTDVFCFAPPDTKPENVPPGALHPRQIMQGVVAGVRDYGNRMGIPTVNGAVCFDKRYVGNPLVYCGTVGLIPVDRVEKEPQPGDLIVTVGGRTGRDGIHGATFSSAELTSESEQISGGAVQIGNAITEKKLLDVILQARDQGLYSAITDCGAGGFSSAIGEMGEKLGAVVHLEKAPLKYEGLSYTEIWISEAQERMILSVPPEKWETLRELCASEDVEATVLGEFEQTGVLHLKFNDKTVGQLDMEFLHEGRPDTEREATWEAPTLQTSLLPGVIDFNDALLKILSCYNVCSKEWIIRQYDHEVQAGSVIKPLVGVANDGPSDAAVVMPVLGSWRGLAIGCGLNPHYGDLDPYRMATAAIDEAVRNLICVGADPTRIALLDNFCWGNTDRREVLGSLVRAAEACRDYSLALKMPFISGKDSLKNEFRSGTVNVVIPPTLLISAIGQVPDVRKCVTMDLKEPGNVLFMVGETRNELGGSHFHLALGLEGGDVPRVNRKTAPKVFAAVHRVIEQKLVRSCHDLSEGGLAVAIAEMAFAGDVGAEVTSIPGKDKEMVDLFSESTTRFVLEVRADQVEAFEQAIGKDVPVTRIGQTVDEKRLKIADQDGAWIVDQPLTDLKEAWQKPLRWD